jgi:hypothetical protein
MMTLENLTMVPRSATGLRIERPQGEKAGFFVMSLSVLTLFLLSVTIYVLYFELAGFTLPSFMRLPVDPWVGGSIF